HSERGAAGREIRSLQDEAPGLAAIARLVDAAVRAVAPELAGYAGIDCIARFGVDQDPDDVLGLAKPHVRPVLAAVGRLVNAVADGDGVAHPGFSGPHPDVLRLRRIDRDRADRLHAHLVEDRLERRAAVLRLPDAPTGCPNEQSCLSAIVAPRDGGDATAH